MTRRRYGEHQRFTPSDMGTQGTVKACQDRGLQGRGMEGEGDPFFILITPASKRQR